MASNNVAPSPLLAAIDYDAYEWLATNAPHYLAAIEKEIQSGRSPEAIRQIVSSRVGSERQGLALRARNATLERRLARYELAYSEIQAVVQRHAGDKGVHG